MPSRKMLYREMSEDTLPKLLRRNYIRYDDRRVAMSEKVFGIWKDYTWKDYYENVKYFSLGLISLGLVPRGRVVIIGDNAPQWHWADLATVASGGISVGIYTDCIMSEVQFIIEHSDAQIVVARDQEQIDKILTIKSHIPQVRRLIYWDANGLWDYDDPMLMSFENVQELGSEYEKTHPGSFEENVEKGSMEDINSICYTSGTTGLPKGAMTTNQSVIADCAGWLTVDAANETNQIMSQMPPAWFGEHQLTVTAPLVSGMMFNYPEEPETSQADMREVGPHVVVFPPRLWESMSSDVLAKVTDAGRIHSFIYHLFIPVGYKMADLRYRKRTPNLFWRTIHKLADVTIFRPVKDQLGLSQVKFAKTGAAALGPDTFRFYRSLGIELTQMYGMTETGGWITMHRVDDVKPETVGNPIVGREVRITDEGEIAIRCPSVFKGYHKAPEITREKLKHNWFSTGDAGYIDEGGHLVFLDRMPDLMELAIGRFSPTFIEGRLKFSPYVRDVMTVGGKDREYVSAIINIDYANVGRWAEKHKIAYTTFTDLSQKQEVLDLIKKDVQRINKSLPEVARIRKLINLYKEFDADEAELTRTRKLRRTYMEERYHDLLSALYGEVEEVMAETEVKYRDGKIQKMKTPVKICCLYE